MQCRIMGLSVVGAEKELQRMGHRSTPLIVHVKALRELTKKGVIEAKAMHGVLEKDPFAYANESWSMDHLSDERKERLTEILNLRMQSDETADWEGLKRQVESKMSMWIADGRWGVVEKAAAFLAELKLYY
jgi:hypothetical protein